MTQPVDFKVLQTCAKSSARVGTLKTRYAEIETPMFMPVGTHGLVRTQPYEKLSELGYQILLTNTYHLLVQLGENFLIEQGGLRNFTGWKNAYLTDSGGFQIFCLPNDRTIFKRGRKISKLQKR